MNHKFETISDRISIPAGIEFANPEDAKIVTELINTARFRCVLCGMISVTEDQSDMPICSEMINFFWLLKIWNQHINRVCVVSDMVSIFRNRIAFSNLKNADSTEIVAEDESEMIEKMRSLMA